MDIQSEHHTPHENFFQENQCHNLQYQNNHDQNQNPSNLPLKNHNQERKIPIFRSHTHQKKSRNNDMVRLHRIIKLFHKFERLTKIFFINQETALKLKNVTRWQDVRIIKNKILKESDGISRRIREILSQSQMKENIRVHRSQPVPKTKKIHKEGRVWGLPFTKNSYTFKLKEQCLKNRRRIEMMRKRREEYLDKEAQMKSSKSRLVQITEALRKKLTFD